MIICDSFRHMFSSSNTLPTDEVLREDWLKVTASMKKKLIGPVCMEVRSALFQMEPSKSSRPDGTTACFFQNTGMW